MKKAVVLAGFGGPRGMDEVRPFVASVLAGRPVPPERVEEVVQHYESFAGKSPYNDQVELQRAALAASLAAKGKRVPVYAAFRHSQPSFAMTLERLQGELIERAAVVVLSAFRSFPSTGRYEKLFEEARAVAAPSLSAVFTAGFHDDPRFVAAQAALLKEAFDDPEAYTDTLAIFSAHSIPEKDDEVYSSQFKETASRVAAEAGIGHWAIAYQSRSGRPEEPWLGPDVAAVVKKAAADGFARVVLSPLGFTCENAEILYDLDVAAKHAAKAAGLDYARADAVGAHRGFIEALAERALAALGED